MTQVVFDDSAPSRPVVLRVRRTARVLERFAWPACCLLMAGWAVAYLGWPFSSDQGVLSWVGRTIADGGMPYRDAWEIRGPAPFLAYAVLARLFGAAQWPLRVLDLSILATGAWCVASIAAAFGGRWAGRVAVALYVLWFASLGHHDTAQSDGWNAAMMAGVALCMLANRGLPGARHAAVAGLLIGLSVVSKPPYAAFVLLPAIIGVAQVSRRGVRWLLGFWGAGALAVVASAGVVLLWLYRGGAMDAFIDVHIRWLLARYTDVESSWLNRIQTTGAFLTASIVATALAPGLLGFVAVWRRDRGYAAVLLAWVGCALLTVMAQGNFYPYHWHPLYPALATPAGIGIAYIFHAPRQPNDTTPHVIGKAVGAAALGAAALLPLVHVYRAAFLLVGILPRERYDAVEFGPYGKTGVFTHLAEYFRTHTSPNETVLVWGSVPNVYYTSERRAPTRFGYTAPLVNPQDDEFRRRYRAEFLAGISARPPAYIATLSPAVCSVARDVDQRRLIGRTEERMRCVEELPGLPAFVADRYMADTTMGPIVVYRRREPPPGSGAGSAAAIPTPPPAAR
jgi:hypothetical protein